MSGHRTERMDHECPVTEIVCCAQQTVKIGMVGDWCGDGYDESEGVEDMIRLTMEIHDPDATCDPGNLWMSRDDALHLADVLRTFAITLERTRFQCQIAWRGESKDKRKEADRG